MKKKKILGIGIVGLSIIFTSFGVFAADRVLSNAQKATIQGLVNTYYTGENPINNLNINKNTKVSDIFNLTSEDYQKIKESLKSHSKGVELTKAIENGATLSEVLTSSLVYASLSDENFDSYKAMTLAVTDQLMEIDKTIDPAQRATLEEKAAKLIKSEYGTVKFGRNSAGNTTLSLEKDSKVILQINSDTAGKIVDVLNSCNNYEEFKTFATELGIKK